ncbi:DUF3291 domain-containing protein [Nocardiopsis sp. EMB25]|uniref:DUF3291 domain-containing protein n=1 Tax=Nocardiopsis TaxID=2013 RepID=UPI0003493974|nr:MULTISPECIES: DUF3291 domain-containing protein [Nocardiopsis]MCY9782601.1 DUF3291 domain-containing protein [Nocardiopsis sp. EMB25]
MQSLIPQQLDRSAHATHHPLPAQRPTAGPTPALPVRGPVLVEALTLATDTGDHRALDTLAEAIRERARSAPGHVGEVHFHDEGNRRRTVALWRSPTDLRDLVHAAHPDILAFRAATGAFPTVERTLWWAAEGTAEVTVDEAERRAAHLREHGPGGYAFTLRSPVPRPA